MLPFIVILIVVVVIIIIFLLLLLFLLLSIVDINDCVDPNPCQNGANCTDLVNSYNCTCTAGYEGNNCETGNCGCSIVYAVYFHFIFLSFLR